MHMIMKFIKFSNPYKKLLLRVLILSLYYRRLISRKPFSEISWKLGNARRTTTESDAGIRDYNYVYAVRRAVHAVVPRLKLKNECLVEAFTARRLLAQRKYPTTVYMGVAKKEDGGLAAHAWTRCGTCIVTGAEGRERFTVTATFA